MEANNFGISALLRHETIIYSVDIYLVVPSGIAYRIEIVQALSYHYGGEFLNKCPLSVYNFVSLKCVAFFLAKYYLI